MAKKWKCKVCGYVHEGDIPPEVCPLCGVGAEMFEKIEDDFENHTSTKEGVEESEKIKIWECTICGYIYEGVNPPEYCPICGVGAELFQVKDTDESKEKRIKFTSNSKENIIIVGNGVAGVSAAKAIRERNSICNITIISQEEYLTYYRPQLTSLIDKEVNYDELYVYKETWYKDNNINIKLNTTVESVEADNHCIKLSSGEKISYDKLILANGSNSFMPTTKGIDKKGVFKLRTLKDLWDIKKYIKNDSCSKIAIIGGGLLGLEAAESFYKEGLKVTVLQRGTQLLSRQLDEYGSNLFETIVDEYGINIVKDANVEEILGEEKVNGVRLSNGEIIKIDLVLFSVGITPNVKLFKETQLHINRGIIVNHKMETNIKDIYACGDVAELNGRVFGIWTPSEQMGITAGGNAIGDDLVFTNFVPSNMFQGMNAEIFSCGDLTEDEKSQTVVVKDPINRIYKRLFFKYDKLVGCILIGDTSKSIEVMNEIKLGRKIGDIVNNF